LTELNHTVAAGSLLAGHPEDVVLVAVERDRPAMLIQISADRPEIIKRRFRGDEPQLHLNLAEGCHLYIALTPKSRIRVFWKITATLTTPLGNNEELEYARIRFI